VQPPLPAGAYRGGVELQPAPFLSPRGDFLMTGAATSVDFVERRDRTSTPLPPSGIERRQFSNNYDDLSPDARELALAVDQYKMRHRRRFISYEEVLYVIEQIGYRKCGQGEPHTAATD
jgi:hypothetical protein